MLHRSAAYVVFCLIPVLVSCSDAPPTSVPTRSESASRAITAAPVAGTVEAILPAGFPDQTTDCVRCYLRWVDLAGANLHGADLRGSDLARANLTGADLADADLRGADLSNARLASADLSGALWSDGTRCATASVGRCRVAPGETPLTRLSRSATVEQDEASYTYIISSDDSPLLRLKICKWYGGKRAAVSLTYDSAYGTWPSHAHTQLIAAQAGLPLNHQIVTGAFRDPPDFQRITMIHEDLLSQGMHVFGHGHQHVNHDSLSYEESLASFTRCFELMSSWGLQPRAYAYPHSAGLRPDTQRAARDAGFICARGSTLNTRNVHICPDDVREPTNWYYLPAISMARDFPAYVNGTSELIPILEETLDRKAWAILMYHAIGATNGWGYYRIRDFYQDVRWIAKQDFWGANMDDAAAYIYERNALQVSLDPSSRRGDLYLRFEDGLDDTVYDQPLTLDIEYIGEIPARGFHADPTLAHRSLEGGGIRIDVVPDGRRVRLRLY